MPTWHDSASACASRTECSTSSVTSVGASLAAMGRAKVSKSVTTRLIRSTSLTIVRAYSCSLGLSFKECSKNWANPRMELNGLRISWATPAASSPMAANFSERFTFSSSCFISVKSRKRITAPSHCPSALRMGVALNARATA